MSSDVAVSLTERERELITTGLYLLEGDCYGDELHPDLAHDLGGTPKGEEVRELLDKIREAK